MPSFGIQSEVVRCKETIRNIAPTGSSGLADDTPLHTDGPDAIPTMAILVSKVAGYLEWAGMEINLKKCGINAMDM